MKLRDLFLITVCIAIAVVIGLAVYNGGSAYITQAMATPTFTEYENTRHYLETVIAAPR